MKNQILVLTFFAFLFVSNLHAQDTTLFGKNFVGAKVLFIDYGSPNDLDSLNITNGLEVVYLRNLSQYVNFGLPVKLGVANVAGDINNRTILSADAILQLQYYQPRARVVPYIFGGGGLVWESDLGTHLQFPFGAGLNIRVGQNSYINLQGEYRSTQEELRNNLQGGLGFIYRLGLGKEDQDRDGISDLEDDCPNLAGPADLGGCPDRDGDGVRDIDDLCVDIPGELAFDGCPDSDGDAVPDNRDDCPDIAGVLQLNGCPDQDKDGVADRNDECPQEAGSAENGGCPDSDGDGIIDREDDCPQEPGLPSNGGCPASDTDGDGIVDEEDACPEVPGLATTNGCPDRDGDGVVDGEDRCPDKAGPYRGCPDTDSDGIVDADDSCPELAGPIANKGCPELKEEDREVLSLAMQAVQFETGSAKLRSSSYEILEEIAAIMQRYPGYDLRISGHTDNVGEEETNQVLSENRARACFQYLLSIGIPAERMSYEGYGETRPLVDNDSSSGRRLNRRVEFELYVE